MALFEAWPNVTEEFAEQVSGLGHSPRREACKEELEMSRFKHTVLRLNPLEGSADSKLGHHGKNGQDS